MFRPNDTAMTVCLALRIKCHRRTLDDQRNESVEILDRMVGAPSSTDTSTICEDTISIITWGATQLNYLPLWGKKLLEKELFSQFSLRFFGVSTGRETFCSSPVVQLVRFWTSCIIKHNCWASTKESRIEKNPAESGGHGLLSYLLRRTINRFSNETPTKAKRFVNTIVLSLANKRFQPPVLTFRITKNFK